MPLFRSGQSCDLIQLRLTIATGTSTFPSLITIKCSKMKTSNEEESGTSSAQRLSCPQTPFLCPAEHSDLFTMAPGSPTLCLSLLLSSAYLLSVAIFFSPAVILGDSMWILIVTLVNSRLELGDFMDFSLSPASLALSSLTSLSSQVFIPNT